MGGLFKAIFGGGGGGDGGGAKAAAPAAASTITGGAVAPGTSAEDFKKQQGAYWQQLLQGTGQTAGGPLPEGLQASIDKQAALIK